jgi:hypothetical protein
MEPLLNVVIEQGGLMEIDLTGRKFTCCNNHENPTYELLDRVLCHHHGKRDFHWCVHQLCLVNSLITHLFLSKQGIDLEYHQFSDLKIASS